MRRRFKFRVFVVILGVFVFGVLLPLMINVRTKDNAQVVQVAYDKETFIKEIAPTAQELSQAYGVRASVIIAQAIFETDYGKSLLAAKYHNLYSLKAKAGQGHIRLIDKIYRNNKWETVKEKFAVYDSWEDSMYSYLEALAAGEWGQDTYTVLATTSGYKIAAEKLQEAGFNSAPNYGQKLIDIIENYNLVDYDR
ncbi:glycoside hydrolase family 73 protein [Streptococcus dentiloxodontae]